MLPVTTGIKIVSYNCRGLRLGHSAGDKAHRFVVDKLLESADILCLQETFLAKQDLEKLNSVHKDFHSAGVERTHFLWENTWRRGNIMEQEARLSGQCN